MDTATPAEMQNVFAEAKIHLIDPLPSTILAQLDSLKGEKVGYNVDRFEHSLQTATRAYRDGAPPDMIVAALLHDIGDALAPVNHSAVAAAILEPYVDEQITWVVRHHGLFQQYHYGDKIGVDPNARDRYRDSPHFDACAHFCTAWDQAAFDPGYESLPIATFEPMVHEVFTRTPRSFV